MTYHSLEASAGRLRSSGRRRRDRTVTPHVGLVGGREDLDGFRDTGRHADRRFHLHVAGLSERDHRSPRTRPAARASGRLRRSRQPPASWAPAERCRRSSPWRTVWPVPDPAPTSCPWGRGTRTASSLSPTIVSESQARYLTDLRAAQVPIVCTTPDAPGPWWSTTAAASAKRSGHLLEHGHHRIAFVAGSEHRDGDSAERLRAFRQTLAEAGVAAR